MLAGCGANTAALSTPLAQQANGTTALPTIELTNTPTLAPTHVPTSVSAATPTIASTSVPVTMPPTSTSVPPTETPLPPTATPRPPTETPLPPTNTPVPPPTPTVQEAPAPPTGLRYVFPVQSSGKISYGQYHHDYPATDIFCPIGSQFVAPTSGTVDWISSEDMWDPATDDPAVRGGRSVAIIGDDGVRYYGSHLSAVADGLSVGQRVDAGQLLGLTGNSGDARFTPPHLHFGISHPTIPDDWQTRRGEVSPFPYLNAWRNGEMITPRV